MDFSITAYQYYASSKISDHLTLSIIVRLIFEEPEIPDIVEAETDGDKDEPNTGTDGGTAPGSPGADGTGSPKGVYINDLLIPN